MKAMKGLLSRVGWGRLTGRALIILFMYFIVLVCAASSYLFDIPPETTLRFFGGLIYLLFLPGFVLCWAIFPDDSEIDSVERLGLSLGLSIPLTLAVVLAADKIFNVPVTPLNIVVSVGVALLALIPIGVVGRHMKKKRQKDTPESSDD